MKSRAPPSLAECLRELEQSDVSALKTQWLTVFGTTAPRRIHRDMLIRAVAWKLQVNAYGDVSSSILKKMRDVAEQLKSRRLKGRSEGKTDVQLRLAPGPRIGTRLIRVWNGDTHVVEVTSRGYEYQSKLYRSLSTIAQRITGTKWNGPLFFGLREKRSHKPSRPLPSQRSTERSPTRSAAKGG